MALFRAGLQVRMARGRIEERPERLCQEMADGGRIVRPLSGVAVSLVISMRWIASLGRWGTASL